jgi:hypothetical protein
MLRVLLPERVLPYICRELLDCADVQVEQPRPTEARHDVVYWEKTPGATIRTLLWGESQPELAVAHARVCCEAGKVGVCLGNRH